MIDVHVLDIRPHPDQATNNPGTWAVRFEVCRDGARRTFWRWYTTCEFSTSQQAHIEKEPEHEEVIRRFWDDTFAELHGFSFDQDSPRRTRDR